MKRTIAPQLALVLVSCVACTYEFPDPNDESELYLCGTEEDCIAGFTCVNQVCLDEKKFGTETVTVRGRILGPPADLWGERHTSTAVYTLIHDTELGAPVDSDGSFALQVPVRDAGEIVVLYASYGDEPQLASVLGEAARLRDLAGAAGAVDSTELGAVNLTPFTTAAYGALYSANGGAVPATRDQLVAAEQKLDSDFTEQQLLDGAAVLHLLVSSTTLDLPAGVSTVLDLACNPKALRDTVASIRELTPVDDLITRTAASLLADPVMTEKFQLRSLPPGYFRATKARNGFIGSLVERLVLGADSTYHGPMGAYGIMPVLSHASWSVAADGRLVVNITESAATYPSYTMYQAFTADQVASYYEDAVTKEAILAAVGTSLLRVQTSLSRLDVLPLWRGTAADWVDVTATYLLRFGDALAQAGLSVDDVEAPLFGGPRFWTRSDSVTYLPWPALDGSTWVLPLVRLLDEPSSMGDPVGSLVNTAAYVTFDSTGFASVHGGLFATTETFRWWQGSDGTITLDYPDGAHAQRVGIWEEQLPVYGVLSLHQLDADTEFLGYDPARRVDLAAMTAELVVTAPGEYWQTQINGAYYPPEAEGSVPRDQWFGWELRADGTATRRYTSSGPDTELDSWTTEPLFWYLDGKDLVLETHMSAEREVSDCTISGSDPSCVVVRRRRWEPISATHDRLNVIESNESLDQWGMFWDGSQWLGYDGAPAELTAFARMIMPRMGTYDRQPIRQ